MKFPSLEISEPIPETYPISKTDWYMGLYYHLRDAIEEFNEESDIGKIFPMYMDRPKIAIFSNRYYRAIQELDNKKVYDYCWIGSIDSCRPEREWVIEFAKTHFTSRSIFINTDNDPEWKSLGDFDLTHLRLGFKPKDDPNHQDWFAQFRVVSENRFYFETMRKSCFILCPAGDAPWSFRMYETVMCDSIPIVVNWHHTYRTVHEGHLGYQYVLNTEIERLEKMCSKKLNGGEMSDSDPSDNEPSDNEGKESEERTDREYNMLTTVNKNIFTTNHLFSSKNLIHMTKNINCE
jgi:hypothetical protein